MGLSKDKFSSAMHSCLHSSVRFYPCSGCGVHMHDWMQTHAPDAHSRERLEIYMCQVSPVFSSVISGLVGQFFLSACSC